MRALVATILMAMAATPVAASPRHAADLTLVGSYGAAEGEAMILERGGTLYLARAGAPQVRLIAAGRHRYRRHFHRWPCLPASRFRRGNGSRDTRRRPP
jgi:hypothetical protein